MPLAMDRTAAVAKRKLRQQMLERRMLFAHAATASASQCVARHFADHPILAFAESFAGYVAIRGELDVFPIFDAMARFRKISALPCVAENKTLQFRRWRKNDPLVRHPTLNVQEPHPAVESVIPAIVMVPLLAFDADGYRLGYGAGYYDRTIAAMRQFSTPPLFFGVGYSQQEVEQVPTDMHDERLDGIITELGVSMF